MSESVGQLDLFGDDIADLRSVENPSNEVHDAARSPVAASERGRPDPSAHELWLQDAGLRKGAGAYYTPADVVERILTPVLIPCLSAMTDPAEVAKLRVIDPACGTGNFLIAAGCLIRDRLIELGVAPADARLTSFTRCVIGVDIDPIAVGLCRDNLQSEAGVDTMLEAVCARVVHADALAMPLAHAAQLFDESQGQESWAGLMKAFEAPDGFDFVVGNPPFLNQLETSTANARDYATTLRVRFQLDTTGYTDMAAIFLLLSLDIVRPSSGVISLVEPTAVLTTRDAGVVRRRLVSGAQLTSLWVLGERIFDAAVDVCVVTASRGARTGSTDIFQDRVRNFSTAARPPVENDNTWSFLLAAQRGLPKRQLRTDGRLADIARATADFRDQYYGLAPHVVDDQIGNDRLPRLITAGLIDPAELLWGQRSTKFNKATYLYPRVQLDGLDEALSKWASSRLVPKVLVATQTKNLEAIVDAEGSLLPSVPVLSVMSDREMLWHIGALLCSPPITLIAAERHLGAALSADALKLSAAELLDLPLPAERHSWSTAATHFERASAAESAVQREAHLSLCAAEMCTAFGLAGDTELHAWWADRARKRRR